MQMVQPLQADDIIYEQGLMNLSNFRRSKEICTFDYGHDESETGAM